MADLFCAGVMERGRGGGSVLGGGDGGRCGRRRRGLVRAAARYPRRARVWRKRSAGVTGSFARGWRVGSREAVGFGG